MAAPVLQNYQYWFGHHGSGKLFGDGTNVDVVRVMGLESFTVRSGNRNIPRGHGAIPGLHLLDEKIVTFELEVVEGQDLRDVLSVMTTLENEEGELHWKHPNQPQLFHRARVAARNEERTGLTTGLLPFTVAFESADPRLYGNARTLTLGIYNPVTGGLDWEIDWELDYSGPPGPSLDGVAFNGGNSAAYPLIRFFGPITGDCERVILTNLTNGAQIAISTSIGSGQILRADMDARIRGQGRRVIELAGSSRYGDWELPRETFHLDPGDNIIRFQIEGTSEDMQASLAWRDTST